MKTMSEKSFIAWMETMKPDRWYFTKLDGKVFGNVIRSGKTQKILIK